MRLQNCRILPIFTESDKSRIFALHVDVTPALVAQLVRRGLLRCHHERAGLHRALLREVLCERGICSWF